MSVPALPPSSPSFPFKHISMQYTDSIRLLKLYPGKRGGILRFALLEVRTGSLPTFDALSYTWGPTKFPKYIADESTGAEIAITENLYKALEVLRLDQEHRLLWIDAVCINQNDDVEKSKQVAMMREIFQRADTVLVWLGSAPENGAESLEILGSLPEMSKPDLKLAQRLSFPQYRIPGFDATDVDLVVSKSNIALSAAITAGIGAIFDSKWFTRVWVIQEYILARNIQIHYGNQALDEKQFKHSVEFVAALMKIAGFKEELKNINRAWTLICSRLQFQLINTGGLFVLETQNFFETALSNFRGQDCCDDRDRVFGLLALSHDLPNIEPDYNRTTAEVYTDFATKNLNYSTLFNAGLCRRGPAPRSASVVLDRDYLPSWCPDFRPCPESWEPVYGNYFATSTSDHGLIGWSRREPNVAVLTAFGICFDLVETAEHRNNNNAFAPTSQPQSFFTMVNHLRSIQKTIGKGFLYPTLELVELALGVTLACGIPVLDTDVEAHPLRDVIKENKNTQTLVCNLWLNYIQYCMEPDGSIYSKVLNIRNESTIPDDFTNEMTGEEKLTWFFHKHLAKVIQTHDMFRTKNGYFGLSPPGTKQGDQIAMLSGHRTPFLIRKAPIPSVPIEVCCGLAHGREEGDTVEYYQVLGPCYVHGIMHGELYKDPVWQERFPWRMMEIYPGYGVPIPAMICHLI